LAPDTRAAADGAPCAETWGLCEAAVSLEVSDQGADEIAGRAMNDMLTPEFLRSIPEQYLPERIAGLGRIARSLG